MRRMTGGEEWRGRDPITATSSTKTITETQKQAPQGRGEHEAQHATIPVVQEVTCGEHGLGKGSKDDDPEFG